MTKVVTSLFSINLIYLFRFFTYYDMYYSLSR